MPSPFSCMPLQIVELQAQLQALQQAKDSEAARSNALERQVKAQAQEIALMRGVEQILPAVDAAGQQPGWPRGEAPGSGPGSAATPVVGCDPNSSPCRS